MARETEKKRAELKEMVIAVTRALVTEEGFGNLSVRKISTGAGCSIGTIYNLFHSLDELIVAVNAGTLDRIYEKMVAALDEAGPDDHRERVLGLVRCYVRFATESFPLWAMLFEHKMEADLPEWYDTQMRRNFMLVEETLKPFAAHAAGGEKRAAKVLWAALSGICSLEIAGKLDTVGAESAMVLGESFALAYLKGLEG